VRQVTNAQRIDNEKKRRLKLKRNNYAVPAVVTLTPRPTAVAVATAGKKKPPVPKRSSRLVTKHKLGKKGDDKNKLPPREPEETIEFCN
jgi:hypothetical protein